MYYTANMSDLLNFTWCTYYLSTMCNVVMKKYKKKYSEPRVGVGHGFGHSCGRCDLTCYIKLLSDNKSLFTKITILIDLSKSNTEQVVINFKFPYWDRKRLTFFEVYTPTQIRPFQQCAKNSIYFNNFWKSYCAKKKSEII